jgi:hypothetical protein
MQRSGDFRGRGMKLETGHLAAGQCPLWLSADMLNTLLVGGTKKWLPTARFRAGLLGSVFWT